MLITEVILVECPDAVLNNLYDVIALSVTGIQTLLSGYSTVIDHGAASGSHLADTAPRS